MSDTDATINIMVVGEAGVGKTNLTTRYIRNEFAEDSTPTIGADFFQSFIQVDGRGVNVKFWDTAG